MIELMSKFDIYPIFTDAMIKIKESTELDETY